MSSVNLKLAEEFIFEEAASKGLSRELVSRYRDTSGRALNAEEARHVFDLVSKRIEIEKAIAGADIEDVVVVADPENHQPWYEDWRKSGVRIQWGRYSEFLRKDLQPRLGSKRTGEIIADIDLSSDRILGRLENPARKEFATKGLVLGYVQSGKTANFTAVVAKAADAGYKLIVVLTGVHENLRWQTQQRLDCQLTGEPDNIEQPHVQTPELEQHRWLRLTDDANDFDTRHKSRLDVSAGRFRSPILAVMKKNCRVMDRLLKWVAEAQLSVRRQIPLLVIDDEADQASIDTKYAARAKRKDIDPTATNKRIRELLRHFPRSAYVGYTATPFANFLISAGTNSKEWGRDLYPRNFIISLNKPKGYFGCDEMFTGGKKRLYFREVPDDERKLLVSSKRNEAGIFPRKITPSLDEAVRSYLLSGAIRKLRESSAHPATMLVNTSNRTESQHRMKQKLESLIAGIKTGLSDKHESKIVEKRLMELWRKDFAPTSKEFPEKDPIEFARAFDAIKTFVNEIQVFELNFGSDDKLDYIREPDLKVLAVGGNKLSRGLTLGGLVTSFYLRSSRQYDTLLQMGRWFGYRRGFEDLTRVYTTKVLADWFEDLALIEREIRDQIRTYEEDDLTPKELAVRIRVHSKMKVTAANKLGAARTVQSSFSGRWTQTIWFPLDQPELLRKSRIAGEDLVRSIGPIPPARGGGGFLATGVSVDKIIPFLERYEFASGVAGQLSGIDRNLLLQYIRRLNLQGRLTRWNVAIASQRNAPDALGGPINFGGVEIQPVSRSRREKNAMRLGVLSTPDHLYIDNPKGFPKDGEDRDFIKWRNGNQPLLLLYYISKHSKPKPPTAAKRSLAAPLYQDPATGEDLLGLVLVFPEFKKDPLGYLGQELDD